MSPAVVHYKTNLLLAVILIILIELKVENMIKSTPSDKTSNQGNFQV